MNTRGYLIPLVAICISHDGLAQVEQKRNVVDVSFLAWKVSLHDEAVMPHMGSNSGAVLALAIFPFKELPMALDVQGTFGRYAKHEGHVKVNTSTNEEVAIVIGHNSRMQQLLFGLKFVETRSTSVIRPYFTPQIGWAFLNSRMSIPDPTDDCRSLDLRVLHGFQGTVFGMEGGLEFSLNAKEQRRDPNWRGQDAFLFASVSMLRGFQPFEYINVRNMQDAPPSQAHARHTGEGEPTDLMAAFVTVSNSEVHYHKVAEVYRTPLRFIGISMGVMFRF